MRIKSFYGDDERELLTNFSSLFKVKNSSTLLCAHNGKEFDYPYLCRRMLVHRIPLPLTLNLIGQKPWEVKHLDTMELWKFGDYKHFTSLQLLASIFNIPSPKDDIDGSMVRAVYYQENNLARIVNYCQKDVITTAQILLYLKQEDMLADHQITVIN